MPSSVTMFVATMATMVTSQAFDPLGYYNTRTQQLGGNSPYFNGPALAGIPDEIPEGCVVDQAAFVSRHGSRYPDPGSYNGWVALYNKIQAATFTATGNLSFIDGWKPVLSDPSQQLMQESIGGWRELMAFGTDLRFRYPNFYTDNTPFTLWANQYPQAPRVVDSARLFARGYLGPNATTNGNVIVLPSVKTGVIGNSLGPSDSCPTYMDTSGGINATNWNNLYLPPIVSRVNSMIKGNLNFTASDVSTMPYLCGFETQITGKQSPWCSVFTDSELRGYEYAQTLRYYYGNGPGSGGNGTLMLSVLNAVVHRLQDGPNETYTNSAGQDFTPGPLAAMFTNDGQISQLISELGVYDDVAPLPSTSIPSPQKYVASNFVTMRGTVQFERLTCSASATNMNGTSIDVRAGTKKYVRILLNNAVYPVVGCADGPGASCQLKDYADIVNKKMKAAGTLKKRCDIPKNSTATITETATFLKDNALPFQIVVKP